MDLSSAQCCTAGGNAAEVISRLHWQFRCGIVKELCAHYTARAVTKRHAHPTPPHPTPPDPTPPRRFRKSTGRSRLSNGRSRLGVLGYLMGVLGYLTGVCGYPTAWRRRQAMAKWRWGRRKWHVASIPGSSPGPRHFLRPKRHLAMAWHPPPGHGISENAH